ncbi:MAG: DUF4369 domain-containing protein [Bacteroidales bacterium]|nr:DUF4369 domain-containing protein [Bacteroidales bacterium]MCM1146566.1 DUF4369 domain-containing protein [Bacteroidales bacterium]MCM1205958.1 DUF4369 domain-containing protein [Bacillota bacterium]MCM1510162.1 DUF4369 domain-containing protein [Clostridium sp.]
MRNILLLLTLILVACGPDKEHFRLKGHLLNLNQGEFCVYSPDGALNGIDTITVAGGRFTYEPVCRHEGMAVIMLPNGMEIPVFMTPGGSASLEGNAHNLRELKVEGGDENRILTDFRRAVGNTKDGGATMKEVQAVIGEHPDSPVGIYLLRRHVLASASPDYGAAAVMADRMLAAQKENVALQVLRNQIAELRLSAKGSSLPGLTGTDITGKALPDINKGTWVICSFASWDYESAGFLRRLATERSSIHAEWNILGVSYDASAAMLLREDRDFPVVCDGKMADSPVAKKFGFFRTGHNILARNGKVSDRDLSFEQLLEKLGK